MPVQLMLLKINIDKNRHTVNVPPPTLTYLNKSILPDSSTNVVVEKWRNIADSNLATLGFNAKKVLIAAGERMDGRETEVRTRPTNLTGLITAAMAYACPKADVALFNAGSIRLDDILTPPITEYDIIRTLPFGGGIREVDMKGDLLLQICRLV